MFLGENIARLAQRPAHNGVELGPIHVTIGRDDRDRVIGPVKNGPGQVVEPRVDQIEQILGLVLHGANLGDQVSALGHQITAGLDLQRNVVSKRVLQPLAGSIPEFKIGVQVDLRFVLAIRHRQAAAGADPADRATCFGGRLLHRAADLGKMFHVGARADVHV